MDPKVKKLLNKIRSNINIPLQRENVVKSTGTKKADVVDINLKDKNVYFSDSIDFNKEPTEEEYEKYLTFFNSNPGFSIKESNRLKLAMRYRPFFIEQGVSNSDVMERTYLPGAYKEKGKNFGTFSQNREVREAGGFLIKQYYPEPGTYYASDSYANKYTVGYNMGQVKNRALSSIFDNKKISGRLIDLINRNTNFDVVVKGTKEDSWNTAEGRKTNYENIYSVRNKHFSDEPYYDTGGKFFLNQDKYNRFYPEQFNDEGFRKMGIFGNEMDADAKYADSLMNERRYRDDPTYSYSPRSFKRYNLEEMLNMAYQSEVINDEGVTTGGEGSSIGAQYKHGRIRVNEDMMGDSGGGVYLSDYGDQFVQHGPRFNIKSETPYLDLYGLLAHEGTHAAEYRAYAKRINSITETANPAMLSGLDGLLGMSLKKELGTRGMTSYHNIGQEYGAFSIQRAVENRENYEQGEESRPGGANFLFVGDSKKQDKFYRILFGN